MSENLMANYIWLINTIESGEFTLNDIAQKWDHRNPSRPFSTRTFHRWRESIREAFGYDIKCRKTGYDYVYFVEREARNNRKNQASEFVINSLSLSNIIAESEDVHDKILLETIPSGYQYLSGIIDGIKRKKAIKIVHKKFVSKDAEEYLLHPYGLKVYKQRWYILAYVPRRKAMRTFALDRIFDLKVTSLSFKENKERENVAAFFADCYGVFHTHKAERIVLKTYGQMADYLRTLPLHTSQQEIENGIFELFLRPETDFINELLSHGANLEVLEPESLRKEMHKEIAKMARLYTSKNK
ncbi:MAG: WYL domain-containing protein [Bacteroidales bacterium]|nr:WYL domain-containing protein [Bacteroidales bacterium]